tara:strand:+ start:642 stop:1325 length:684 start_codon:yes stop_codon:yes gene_type:complete
MKSKKLIIFGTGIISDCLTSYFENQTKYEIVAYSVDKEFINTQKFKDKPLLAKEDIIKMYTPNDCYIFVALGYHNLNKLREDKFNYFKKNGFRFASLIPDCYQNIPVKIGQNCLVLPGVTLQPHCQINDNVFIWSNALIGHHSIINNNCWVTGGSTIGGVSKLGDNSFLGLNATVGPNISIGENCILGAHTLTTRNLLSNSVVVQPDTSIHRLDSNQFLRITREFSS